VSAAAGSEKNQRYKNEEDERDARKKNRSLSCGLPQEQESDGCDDTQQTENNLNQDDGQQVDESWVQKQKVNASRQDQDGSDEKNQGNRDDRGWCSQEL
jgi:hypothetical protein